MLIVSTLRLNLLQHPSPAVLHGLAADMTGAEANSEMTEIDRCDGY